MTEEQEAIEIIDKMIKSYIEADECGLSNNDFKYEIGAMQTVLNMLKEKGRQINSKNGTINALQCALKERTEERDKKDDIIAKQNKIIDAMAGYITTLDIEEDICSKTENEHCDKMNFGECEECITQYFERMVEDGD